MPNIFQTPEERKRLENAVQNVNPIENVSDIATQPNKFPWLSNPTPTQLTKPMLSTTPKPPMQETPDTQSDFEQANPAQTPATTLNQGVGATLVPVEKVATSVSGTSIRPQDRKAIDDAQTELTMARTENISAQTEAAKAAADLQTQQANKLASDAELMRIEQERIATLKDANRQKYLNKISEYEGMKIENPWANMSTGSKIMAGISIALGGMAGQNGQNAALDIINTNITRDIDIQKANMDKKKGELNAIQQYGTELRQMGLDDMSVREAMIGMGKQQLAAQLEVLKNRIGDKDARYPQVTALQQKFAQDALDEKLKIAELGASKTVTSKSVDFVETGKTAQKIPDTVKQQLADLNSIKSTLDRIESEKSKINTGPIPAAGTKLGEITGLGFSKEQSFNALLKDATRAYAKARESGVLSNQDIEGYEKIMPSIGQDDDVFTRNLQQSRQSLELKEKALREQYGLPMQQPSQTETKIGK